LQNPTREELENTIANIENGKFGFAFSSGMAAVSTILSLFSPKDHIIVSDDLYGGTYRLFEEIYKKYGLEFSYVNTSRIQDIEEAVKENTKAFFIETPTNPMMKVADLKTISRFAKTGKYFDCGQYFSYTVFSEALGAGGGYCGSQRNEISRGHNDTLAGLVVVNDEELAEG